uniref:Uncharacterized protein n=1 Tax=Haptolina brevifila TaxID=156173 RepID=A0A7S2JTF9_9EUKA|mmetsp:Transcript_971/g.2066  ORF Transcript_971/g.2066 Transcript_971/m.2066 type:complete len:229 (+) Transcript_971:602-1288(+)
MSSFNRSIEELLKVAGSSGVVALNVPAAAADSCAAYLHANWVDGSLPLPGRLVCQGYSSYGKTLSVHDAEKQRLHTLLITRPLLRTVRLTLPGFQAIEEYLVVWLESQYGTVVELFYAHGLRQGPATLCSTGFNIHQETSHLLSPHPHPHAHTHPHPCPRPNPHLHPHAGRTQRTTTSSSILSSSSSRPVHEVSRPQPCALSAPTTTSIMAARPALLAASARASTMPP